MADTLTYTTTLQRVECGSCYIPFAIPENLYDARLADGKSFYCPNGHAIGWTDNENKRLRREKERLERLVAAKETSRRAALDQAAAAERRRAAAKGQLTKVKNRIGNGVCPCCKRHFANVERHMTTQHPDFATHSEPSLEASRG